VVDGHSHRLRPVLAWGTISYATYLWNSPIAVRAGAQPLGPWRAPGSILLAIAVATISWKLGEKPIVTIRRRMSGPEVLDVPNIADVEMESGR
jgi:peptidoglycan/LPS O-acetylase OafA/YrhL